MAARRVIRSAASDAGTDATALADRLRARDPEAERELIVRYRPGVTMILRRLVKDPTLAEDLAQEVFRIALEALRQDRLHEAGKLASYLWGITRNVARSEIRAQPDPHDAADGTLVDPALRPDQQLLRAERARRLRDTLQALSPRDRLILRDFYLNDVPKESICRRLGLSPPQFDLAKWRALKRLRAHLGHDND